VRRILARCAVRAKVSRLSPHSFRHAAASILLSAGENPEYVSRMLGHSDLKLLKVYGRWLPTKSSRVTAPAAQPVAAPSFARLVAVDGHSGRIAGQVA